jgi:hypothetical protein
MAKETFRKYTELFSTPLGKEVLEDLQSLWRIQPVDLSTASLAHLEGQRHVMRFIETQIKKGNAKE